MSYQLMQVLSLTLVFILGLALMGQAQSIEVSKERVISEKSSPATATKNQFSQRKQQAFYFKRLQPDGTYTYRKVEGFGRTVEDIDATKREYEAYNSSKSQDDILELKKGHLCTMFWLHDKTRASNPNSVTQNSPIQISTTKLPWDPYLQNGWVPAGRVR